MNNEGIKNKSGIYKILCLTNGKFYIGSSVNMYQRKIVHFDKLRKNKHDNVLLQRAFNKYGESVFIFEVVEYVLDKNILTKREQYYIDLYNACDCKIGFNICPTANSMLGFKHSEETKKNFSIQRKGKNNPNFGKKLSQKQRDILSNKGKERVGVKNTFYGKKHTQKTKEKIRTTRKKKKVICIENNIVYESIMDAERQTGANHSSIIRACNGKNKTAGKLHWQYY